jgi:MATE family multidrug resistance protein
MASNSYLAPYIVVVTLTTWLESIEIVKETESIAAAFSLLKVFFSWFFMYGICDKCLNGYAYASAVSYGGQLFVLLLIVFYIRKHHMEYWRGWDIKGLLDRKLNRRFVILATPLVVQYAMQNWAWMLLQGLMSSECEDLAAAYGVTSAFTNTAGSVSTALYVAVSVRVGTNLGEGRPAAAKRVMYMGFIFAAAAGVIISTAIYFGRYWLATFFSDDPKVNEMTVSVGFHVALYYFLNSCMWGVWAPLEGQMRTTLPSISLIIGMWGVTVPLSVATIKYEWWGVDTPLEKLAANWWVGNLGMFVTWILMMVANLTADWEALSLKAQESEVEEDKLAGSKPTDSDGLESALL